MDGVIALDRVSRHDWAHSTYGTGCARPAGERLYWVIWWWTLGRYNPSASIHQTNAMFTVSTVLHRVSESHPNVSLRSFKLNDALIEIDSLFYREHGDTHHIQVPLNGLSTST